MSLFSSLMSTNIDDVEAPRPVPEGWYVFRIASPPNVREGETGSGFEYASFTIPAMIVSPHDVDLGELDAFGDPGGIFVDLSWFRMEPNPDWSEESRARAERRDAAREAEIANFFKKTLDIRGVSLEEACAQSVGREFLGKVKWEAPRDDPEGPPVPRIKKTLPCD